MKIDVGERQYELVQDWGRLPEGWRWGQCAGVACDSQDNVFVFTRTEHPLMVFDKSGKLVDHWGEELFEHPHGICITPNDDVYFVETVTHLITKFDKAGKHKLSIGKRHQPSDTGYTQDVREPAGPLASGGGMPIINGVAHSAGPFHQPTDISIADNGDIFVSDGYRNARAHWFHADGSLVKSWGEPGNAKELKNTKDKPGYFHTPHGIWVHKDRVYVSDRENYRIQIYTTAGEFVDIWTDFERPTKIYVDPSEEVMYVSELEDRCSIVDLDGNVIGRYGSERSNEPGKFWGPHGIWVDSEGSIYIAEVLNGARMQKFARMK
jgi:DNA-binding beta-propeller fold protein YncE